MDGAGCHKCNEVLDFAEKKAKGHIPEVFVKGVAGLTAFT